MPSLPNFDDTDDELKNDDTPNVDDEDDVAIRAGNNKDSADNAERSSSSSVEKMYWPNARTHAGCRCKSSWRFVVDSTNMSPLDSSQRAGQVIENSACANPDNDPGGIWCFIVPGSCTSIDTVSAAIAANTVSGAYSMSVSSSSMFGDEWDYCDHNIRAKEVEAKRNHDHAQPIGSRLPTASLPRSPNNPLPAPIEPSPPPPPSSPVLVPDDDEDDSDNVPSVDPPFQTTVAKCQCKNVWAHKNSITGQTTIFTNGVCGNPDGDFRSWCFVIASTCNDTPASGGTPQDVGGDLWDYCV
eukprot:gene13601-16082_t